MDVTRGIHVPVETNAAGTAFEDPNTESELGFRLATVRAHLRRGVKLIDDDDAMPSFFSFITELTPQLIKSSITNRTP